MSQSDEPRPPRPGVVQHDARLDILCCLDADEPMDVAQVSGRTGIETRRAEHHMRILEAFGLVGAEQNGTGGRVLYVLRLDRQPEWVSEAVESHRSADGC